MKTCSSKLNVQNHNNYKFLSSHQRLFISFINYSYLHYPLHLYQLHGTVILLNILYCHMLQQYVEVSLLPKYSVSSKCLYFYSFVHSSSRLHSREILTMLPSIRCRCSWQHNVVVFLHSNYKK